MHCRGQQRRHVASTQMNRESSRSHLIISVCIEATNLQTQNVTRGKLSFVDLAGSERCDTLSTCCLTEACPAFGSASRPPTCRRRTSRAASCSSSTSPALSGALLRSLSYDFS